MTSILKVSEIQDPTNGNTALTVDTSGYTFLKLPHFNMTNTSVQSVPNGTYTRAEFNTSTSDTHSFVDLTNNKINFTSTTAGVYQINLGGKVENFNGSRMGYWLRKEGSMNTGPYIAYFETEGDGTYAYPTFNFILSFAAGDFLELDLYQNQGSTMNTYPQSQSLGFFISGFRIG